MALCLKCGSFRLFPLLHAKQGTEVNNRNACVGLWRNWSLALGYILTCAVKIQVAWDCWGFCARVSVGGTEKRQKVDSLFLCAQVLCQIIFRRALQKYLVVPRCKKMREK